MQLRRHVQIPRYECQDTIITVIPKVCNTLDKNHKKIILFCPWAYFKCTNEKKIHFGGLFHQILREDFNGLAIHRTLAPLGNEAIPIVKSRRIRIGREIP